MAHQPQTAIRGVFSVATINVLARLLGYGKHIVITAYIGLNASLDAYYFAISILSVFVLTFGDVFDSLGIPRLVKTLQEDGEDEFRSFAGSIVMFAFVLSAILAGLLILIAPWSTWIAPGFTPDKKSLVLKNIYLLLPMALVYLPYHAIGSVLRSRRRFKDFYFGELVIATTTLVALWLGRDHSHIVPVSTSVGYGAVLAYVIVVGSREFRLCAEVFNPRMRQIFLTMLSLLPIYLTSYLFVVVDRVFASYLPTGSVSALSYGMLIAQIPASILMMENVFITPLSESPEKEKLMKETFVGVLIITIPIVFFIVAYANPIVRICLERGVFTAASTKVTADALTYISLSIPAFFLWPIQYRLFQIMEKLNVVIVIPVAALVLNAILNALFLKLNLGVKGLALATSIAAYVLVGGGGVLLRKHGIRVFAVNVRNVLFISVGISTSALLATSLLPISTGTSGRFVILGACYILLVGILFYAVPDASIKHWRETVARELMPTIKTRWHS